MNGVLQKIILICAAFSLFLPGCTSINKLTRPVTENTELEIISPDNRISFPDYGLSVIVPPDDWEMQHDLGVGELALWMNREDGSIIEIMASRSSRNLSYHDIAREFMRATCNLVLQKTLVTGCDIMREEKVSLNEKEFYKVVIAYKGARSDRAVKSTLYLHRTRDFVFHFIFMEEYHDFLATDMMTSVVFLDAVKQKQPPTIRTSHNLIDACYYGDTETVKKLLAAGANVNAKNKDGVTALSFASDRGHLDIVKILLGNNADVNARSNIGSTPLMNAAFMGHVQIVELLIANGADENARSCDGTTALMNAAAHGHEKIVEILLAGGVDVDACEICGLTALWNAVTADRSDIVATLIKYGADINVKADDGTTVLMNAAFIGNVDIVKMLLSAGADVNVKSHNGFTALIIAKRKGHADIVKLLREAGALEDSPLGPGFISPVTL